MVRPTVVNIDLAAASGRSDLKVGDRVRVGGTGLLAGSSGTIDRLIGGVISAAVVKSDDGQTARVRTHDLEPIRGEG